MEPVTLAITLLLAVLVGITVGLLGGGGSILLVPLLVYVAGVGTTDAVVLSLLLVGFTAGVAAVSHARAGRVDWATAVVFGGAAMLGAYAGGLVGARLPGAVLLVAFAAMMLVASGAMLRGGRLAPGPRTALLAGHAGQRVMLLAAQGAVVGFVTGMVGSGGGFLVVPALALLAGLPMPHAIGTASVIVSAKSFAGLVGFASSAHVDPGLALPLLAVVTVGAIAGAKLVDRVSADRLQLWFGILVVVVALGMLAQELPVVASVPLAVAASAAVWRLVAQRRPVPSPSSSSSSSSSSPVTVAGGNA